METNKKDKLHCMMTSSPIIANDDFINALKKLAKEGHNDEYYKTIEQNSLDLGHFVEYIAEVGNAGWVEGELEDGTAVLLAKNGENTAYAYTKEGLSEASRDTLTSQNIDVERLDFKREVEVVFSCRSMDFTCLWSVTGELLEKKFSPLVLAGMITKGLTSLFKALVNGLSVMKSVLQLAGAIEAGAPEGVDIDTGPPSKWVKVLGYAAQFVVLVAAFYIMKLLIEKVLLQVYQSHVLIFNLIASDMELTLPYLYNAAKQSHPEPEVGEQVSWPLKGIQKIESHTRTSGKTHIVHIAAVRLHNNNKFLSGLGWVAKLQPKEVQGFENAIATQSIPRFGSYSLSVLFNDNRAGKEIFDEEEEKHQESRVQIGHGRYKNILTAQEKERADGYQYICSWMVVDTQYFDI